MSSALASLVVLMGTTQERVSALEAATAKHEVDVANAMSTLTATTAAHATAAAAVAEIGTIVADVVDNRVGCHIGSLTLRSEVSSLGQDVLALCSLLATMHGQLTANTSATVGTVSPHKPPDVFEDDSLPDVDDTPPTAPPEAPRPVSKLFPNVDSTNLHVDATHHARFHAHPGDQRFPTGGRHAGNVAPSDGDRWSQGYSQRAPTPVRPYPVNTNHHSHPHFQDSRPHFQDSRPQETPTLGDEDTALLGGAISSSRNIGHRRQAATARVSQFDIAALANAKYHGGGEGYYPLTPAIIHTCGFTAINTVNVIGSYNEIILVHESVLTNWVGRHTVGPQIDCILEKAPVSLPRLQSLEVESAVEWYNYLQKTLMIYLVPITPLDCVMIKMGYEALVGVI
jgi:hypothetical protein